MAYSRSSPMNDIGISDQDGAIARDLEREPAVERDIEEPLTHRPAARRRRWGGRLFALGAVWLLAGGLSLGTWRHYAQQQEVTATAEQARDFVPTVRVATVEPSPAAISVTLPGTTAAFA